MKAWADARRPEGTAFVIPGAFNRRLALPGDWARRLLVPPSAPLRQLTEGVTFRCDPERHEARLWSDRGPRPIGGVGLHRSFENGDTVDRLIQRQRIR